MRKSVKRWFSWTVLPLIIGLLLLAVACAAAAPQEREISVQLTAGHLDPDTIRVGQNDTVTLKIQSDQPGALHLHGYDLEQEIDAGAVTDFVFVAGASGRFRIAFHPMQADAASHEESGHDEIPEDSHDDPGHKGDGADTGHAHGESEAGNEIDVGFLEVQPR